MESKQTNITNKPEGKPEGSDTAHGKAGKTAISSVFNTPDGKAGKTAISSSKNTGGKADNTAISSDKHKKDWRTADPVLLSLQNMPKEETDGRPKACSSSAVEACWATWGSEQGRLPANQTSAKGNGEPQSAPGKALTRKQRRKAKLERKKKSNKEGVTTPSTTTPAANPSSSACRETDRPQAKPGPSKESGKEPLRKGKASGKGGANAKRARPDETISPKGEPKKQKLCPSRGPKPPSYAAAAGSNININKDIEVAITKTTSRFIAREVATTIEEHLLDQYDICALCDDKANPKPAFCGKPRYLEGCLRLQCQDVATVQWVKHTIASYKGVEDLVVLNPEDIPRRVRVGILLPTLETDRVLVGKRLNMSNPWAQAQRWLLHAMHRQENVGATFLTLSVPEDMIPEVMARKRRLSYRLGSVYVKFRDARGRYVEVPPTRPGGIDGAANLGRVTSTPSKPETDPKVSQDTEAGPSTGEPGEELLLEDEILGLNELVLNEEDGQDATLY